MPPELMPHHRWLPSSAVGCPALLQCVFMHKEQAKELTSEDKAKNGDAGDSDDKTKRRSWRMEAKSLRPKAVDPGSRLQPGLGELHRS